MSSYVVSVKYLWEKDFKQIKVFPSFITDSAERILETENAALKYAETCRDINSIVLVEFFNDIVSDGVAARLVKEFKPEKPHVITAKYIPATNKKPARVSLYSRRFRSKVIIPTNGDEPEPIIRQYLNKKGFTLLNIGILSENVDVLFVKECKSFQEFEYSLIYHSKHGKDIVTYESSYSEILKRKKEYEENEPGFYEIRKSLVK